MGQIVFQATLGGQTALVGQNTASSYSLTLPLATDTLVGKATTDTLTNKTISGASNTLSNIANSSLTNSSVTIGSTSVSLGGTASTIAGLTLTSPTINGGTSTATQNLANVTGTLAVGNGGTGLTTLTAGYIPYGNGTSAFSSSANLQFDGNNLGIGTTPSAWYSVNKIVQLPYASFSSNSGSTGLFSNSYFNASAQFIYSSTNYATLYNQSISNGQHQWFTAPSGTAGTAITFTQAMTLDNSGNLGIGVTSMGQKCVVGGATDTRIQINGSSSGGIYFTQNNADAGTISGTTSRLAFFAGGYGEAMRINSSGNLLLGTTTAASAAGVAMVMTNGTSGGIEMCAVNNGGGVILPIQTGGMQFYTFTGAVGSEAYSERMRVDTSGNLLVGTTSAGSGIGNTATGAGFYASGNLFASASSNFSGYFNRSTTDGGLIRMQRGGTEVGSISVTTTATAYNTSSDQRLKTNIVDAPSGKIDAIKVRSFDWIADGSHQEYGMVAQELLEVAPYAVSQSHNPDEMMGVDYSKLVPMMIKEIQDLKAEVKQLKEKVGI